MSHKPFVFEQVTHWVSISVRENESCPLLELIEWKNLPFEVLCKWKWYFKYRAALLQVKYPKHIIDYRWGSQQPEGVVAENLKANKIRSKRAKITEVKNKMELAKKHWNFLFPIEDDQDWKRAISKLKTLENELSELLA
jgi:hypothetical protein